MAYIKSLPFLIMGSMMIVLSHEKASKYGLMIVAATVAYLWLKSQLKKEKSQ